MIGFSLIRGCDFCASDSLKYFRGSGFEPPFELVFQPVLPVFVPVNTGSTGLYQIDLMGWFKEVPGRYHS